MDDYTIHQNIFEGGFLVAIEPRSAGGNISTNYIKDAFVGMFIQGPGTVDLHDNRVLAYRGGVYLSTTVQHFPFNLGVQAGKFSIEPFEIPTVAHLDGSITNNDLSGHISDSALSFGLRMTLYGYGTASYHTEQSLNYIVRDNTIQDNVLGVVVDAGYSERNDLPPTGNFSGAFSDNDVSGNCRASMLLSFTRWDAALYQNRVSRRPYLQDSTYDLTFSDSDEDAFADRWIDHPGTDPVDGRTLNNLYLENGVPVANERDVPFDPEDSGPCVFD